MLYTVQQRRESEHAFNTRPMCPEITYARMMNCPYPYVLKFSLQQYTAVLPLGRSSGYAGALEVIADYHRLDRTKNSKHRIQPDFNESVLASVSESLDESCRAVPGAGICVCVCAGRREREWSSPPCARLLQAENQGKSTASKKVSIQSSTAVLV